MLVLSYFISAFNRDYDKDYDKDYDVARRRQGGYVKTHSKRKSSIKMSHEHEHGHEKLIRYRREAGAGWE